MVQWRICNRENKGNQSNVFACVERLNHRILRLFSFILCVASFFLNPQNHRENNESESRTNAHSALHEFKP